MITKEEVRTLVDSLKGMFPDEEKAVIKHMAELIITQRLENEEIRKNAMESVYEYIFVEDGE